jgi:hypothetical protein
MAKGKTKNAFYIADEIGPLIDKIGAEFVDLLLFDGASNVQKAGRLLSIKYPRITTRHGAEHVIALHLGDIAKSFHVKLLIRVYRRVYHWFGGSVHLLYAVLQRTTAASNQYSGVALAIILARDI